MLEIAQPAKQRVDEDRQHVLGSMPNATNYWQRRLKRLRACMYQSKLIDRRCDLLTGNTQASVL